VKVQSRFIVLSFDFQKGSLAASSARTSAPADGAVPPIGVNGDAGMLAFQKPAAFVGRKPRDHLANETWTHARVCIKVLIGGDV
jgi:hypothetical protein